MPASRLPQNNSIDFKTDLTIPSAEQNSIPTDFLNAFSSLVSGLSQYNADFNEEHVRRLQKLVDYLHVRYQRLFEDNLKNVPALSKERLSDINDAAAKLENGISDAFKNVLDNLSSRIGTIKSDGFSNLESSQKSLEDKIDKKAEEIKQFSSKLGSESSDDRSKTANSILEEFATKLLSQTATKLNTTTTMSKNLYGIADRFASNFSTFSSRFEISVNSTLAKIGRNVFI